MTIILVEIPIKAADALYSGESFFCSTRPALYELIASTTENKTIIKTETKILIVLIAILIIIKKKKLI